MEMLLEAQVTFSSTFLKTFVDRLLLADESVSHHSLDNAGESALEAVGATTTGFSRETCDWLLSVIGPLSQVVGIFCYIPIRRLGYPAVYRGLFLINLFLSTVLLVVANGSSTYWVALFLTTYPVFTAAVQSAGFHLAMSDMVLEMKRKHYMQGRYNEPSLAALFMGANALFCKPMETLLPIIAASVMESATTTTGTAIQSHDDGTFAESDMLNDTATKKKFFHLLVLPPFFFSIIQLLAWSAFSLTPKRTAAMRQDLRHLQQEAASMTAADDDDDDDERH